MTSLAIVHNTLHSQRNGAIFWDEWAIDLDFYKKKRGRELG